MPSGRLPPTESAPLPAPGYWRRGLASELALLRLPKVLLAALALIFVPSLYVLIYVSSVWDPYGSAPRLPAALVNQDVPVGHAGRDLDLGGEIAATLEKQRPFAFRRFASPEAARAAVQTGEVFFALLIPPDFSRAAMAGGPPAQLEIYVSEGGNYTASVLSRRFGSELAHTINEQLGSERWAALVGPIGRPGDLTLHAGLRELQTGGRELAAGAAKVGAGSDRLRVGLGGAQEGAAKLADGSGQLAAGSARLTDGLKQVAAAVATIRSKLPEERQLGELVQGSHALTEGSTELKHGLVLLADGATRLDAGAGELRDGAAKVPFVGGKISAGASRLEAGIGTLGAGIARAGSGAEQLNDGLIRLDAAVQPLATGLTQLNAGLATLGGKLPPAEQLDRFDLSMGRLRDGNVSLAAGLSRLQAGGDQLTAGASDLAAGADRLAAGLDAAVARFEAGMGEASAGKLAAPVTVRVTATAPVPNNGTAFAPYFSALSLWVGAVMMSFVFYLRRLPDFLQPAPRLVKWLAKAPTLLALGALQATVVVGVLRLALGVHFAQPLLVWLVAVLGSLAFVSLVLLFITVLGDAGRLLAIVLLILQLAASGGVYPVELSPAFYQTVHGYLPFTCVVRAFRATMFGAFDGRWGPPAGELALFAGAAVLLTVLLARWKYVPKAAYGPAVEF